MHQDPNTDLDHRINAAISRHLSSHPTSLSLTDAAALARYAHDAAVHCNVPVVFSLVDARGQQRYFFSMDNALPVSHTLAGKKAWSAAALRMPTHELAAAVQPGASLYCLQNEPGICCLGGGLPCWSSGRLLGAIGISGGSVEEDIAIASAALAQFSREHFPLTSVNPSIS